MILESLKRHFPARAPEWLNGLYMLPWGLYVLTHPQLFTLPQTAPLFSGMAGMVGGVQYASLIWGGIPAVVGALRIMALCINGFWSATPKIRLVCSFASAFVWTQIVVGLMKSGLPNTGLIIYTGLIFADIYSSFRATWDVVLTSRVKRVEQAERRSDVERSNSGTSRADRRLVVS